MAARKSRVLAPAVPAGAAEGSGLRRRRPRSCSRIRPAAADQRRAARRVPERRHRFEHRRRADGETLQRAVKTFSIGFAEKRYDELDYARAVARHFKTDHQEFVVRPNAVEIIRSSSGITTSRSRIPARSRRITSARSPPAREGALTGDAGDEGFAGYPRYRAVKLGLWFDRLPEFLRRALAGKYWQRLRSRSSRRPNAAGCAACSRR